MTATPKVGSKHRLEDRSNKSTTLGKLSCYHFISTTHDCYDRSSSPIHPRKRHWFTKYSIMGLGHKVLAGDAVLTSGLDGESIVVGEPFWRSFDAHELRQRVTQEKLSLD